MLSASVSGTPISIPVCFVDIIAHAVFDGASVYDTTETVFYMGDPFDASDCDGGTDVACDISEIGVENIENWCGCFVVMDDVFP
jgi:hypothetical protein